MIRIIENEFGRFGVMYGEKNGRKFETSKFKIPESKTQRDLVFKYQNKKLQEIIDKH